MVRLAAKGSRIPYLDGLRAYSILLVLFGHTIESNPWLHARWYLQVILANSQLGVRIFFVLSGFLITTLLLNEQDASGRISIRGFYERRIARIFPAFYLYIAIIGVLTAVHVMNVPAASFYAASTYTWNLFALRPGGHGDPTGVFVHIWTLSIEEQFYLFWPSFLVLLGRRWTLRLALACVALFPLIRLSAFFLLDPANGQRDMILTQSGQDMIMWGCLGAFAVRGGLLERLSARRYRFVDPMIVILILFSGCGLLLAHLLPGFKYYLLPTTESISTLILVFWLLTGEGGLLRRGLEAWPVVQLGLISYSLYIWQQPFTMWPGMSWLHFPWNVLLPVPVAVASYRLVEVPMRKLIRRWFSQPQPAH
jgi:peptidoglycan/LPS O-acetylase OafA/YrhL